MKDQIARGSQQEEENSHKFRVAQFIRAFQESSVSSSRFEARSAYLKKEFVRREGTRDTPDSGIKVLGIK
ncbi:unnamed protein product [Bathycoccus prasinos]